MSRRGRTELAMMTLLGASAIFAATLVPDSSILPASITTTLSSKHGKVGQAVTARIMQDVPLLGDAKIPAGSILSGHVTRVHAASGEQGGTISFRFDTLRIAHENARLTVSLRALASFVEVQRAQLPTGNDPGIPENAWVTVQVGGEVVYRTSGTVRSRSLGVVGRYVKGGVLGELVSNPGRGCRNDGTGERAQALWVFSSDACGVYGLDRVTIVTPEGDAADPGEITLQSSRRDVTVNQGSGLLLRVYAPRDAGQTD